MRNYNVDKADHQSFLSAGSSSKTAAATAKSADQQGGHGSTGGNETPCSCPGCFPMFDW